ncbi:MAG: hypothetical protein VX986_07575 [Pseudomonadota bacterium]|nr:hypothetical protein [Pseudomonadota bacterium]
METRENTNIFDQDSKAGLAALPEFGYREGREYPPNLYVNGAKGERYYLEYTVWDKYY